MEVFKDAHEKFQADCVRDVYMLQNSEVTVGRLQLSSVSKMKVVKQSETTTILNFDVQLYPKGRLGLDVQQESPDCYSYGEANSHKSCVDH